MVILLALLIYSLALRKITLLQCVPLYLKKLLTIQYYNSNSSSVFCVMLDATKAFGRVEYCKLSRKLLDKKLPVVIVPFC